MSRIYHCSLCSGRRREGQDPGRFVPGNFLSQILFHILPIHRFQIGSAAVGGGGGGAVMNVVIRVPVPASTTRSYHLGYVYKSFK
jgi:hypothetical protein